MNISENIAVAEFIIIPSHGRVSSELINTRGLNKHCSPVVRQQVRSFDVCDPQK